MLATNFGLPISTTHCVVGSLGGIVAASQFSVVKQAYKQTEEVEQPLIQNQKDEN